ncbi:hypothetical protein [Streptomyces flavidovirens]|uniref:hypothetical protein n=1 Tax=Streptomyces flavidovirens TaxID=67298 RepID=UPI003692A110
MSAYGRDENEWDQLVEAGLRFLVERARMGKVTTYTELNTVLAGRTKCRGFDFERADERAAMGHLLGLIVERDQESAGTAAPLMISALVHYLSANDAGPGFYALAKELGLLPRDASKTAKEVFWISQVNALHRHYGSARA